MGLAYNITKPLQYDEPLANMFGGKPLNAKVKLYFESVDFEAGYCVRKQEMNIDPKDTKRIIKQAV